MTEIKTKYKSSDGKETDDIPVVDAQVFIVDSQCPKCQNVESHNSKEWPFNHFGAFISGIEYGVECSKCNFEYGLTLPQNKKYIGGISLIDRAV